MVSGLAPYGKWLRGDRVGANESWDYYFQVPGFVGWIKRRLDGTWYTQIYGVQGTPPIGKSFTFINAKLAKLRVELLLLRHLHRRYRLLLRDHKKEQTFYRRLMRKLETGK